MIDSVKLRKMASNVDIEVRKIGCHSGERASRLMI